jgi:hypothetical protein
MIRTPLASLRQSLAKWRARPPAGLPLLELQDIAPATAQPPLAPPPATHMLWLSGEMPRLVHHAMASFLANGYDLTLWSYDPPREVPAGATLRDAREILPRERIFLYRNGSPAGFANLFRYALLARFGGLWVDTDTICLMPASALPRLAPGGCIATERIEGSRRLQVNNNFIYHPDPRRGDFIDLAHRFSDGFDPERLDWGDCGPKLLTLLAEHYAKLAPPLLAPDVANPVGYWQSPSMLFSESARLPEGAGFLHCYADMWRRAGIDPTAPIPPASLLGRVLKRYE